uniref:Isoamyl acetate-hydrolyzing esterase 1 homolog n=1 Tax=Gallus gallus TaxID=9031 RepID=A0A8V0XG31_CHICK
MALVETAVRGRLLPWPRVVLFGDSITEVAAARRCRSLRTRRRPGGARRWFVVLYGELSSRQLWGAGRSGLAGGREAVLTARFVSKPAPRVALSAGRAPLWSRRDRRGRPCAPGCGHCWAVPGRAGLPNRVPCLSSPSRKAAGERPSLADWSDVNPRQHVPLEEYAANLTSMVRYLKSIDITEDRIILITPPPLQESAWEKECLAKGDKLNRRNATTGEYAQACVQVARDCGTDVLDLWTLMQKDQDFSCYLSDGLHLSMKGNNFLVGQLWSHLEKRLSALPSLLPYWRDVDPQNPEVSLLGAALQE